MGTVFEFKKTKQIGTDTSDATLTSGSQILSGYTAYSKGTKYTGTITTRSASSATISGKTVTVPAGYYPSQFTKTVSTISELGSYSAAVTQESSTGTSSNYTTLKSITVPSGTSYVTFDISSTGKAYANNSSVTGPSGSGTVYSGNQSNTYSKTNSSGDLYWYGYFYIALSSTTVTLKCYFKATYTKNTITFNGTITAYG